MAAATPELRWVRRAPRGIQPGSAQPRLGVLGGTFNPVTRAHLALAEAARASFKMAEVLFVLPAALPHRTPQEAALEARVALLEAALRPHASFSLAVCSHGLFVEMAEALKPHYPEGTKLFFLAGSDAAERILAWDQSNPEKARREMFARFDLVVAARAGRTFLFGDRPLEAFRPQIHTLALPEDVQEVSATAVRERRRAGQPIDDLVPPAVAAAIREMGLYPPR